MAKEPKLKFLTDINNSIPVTPAKLIFPNEAQLFQGKINAATGKLNSFEKTNIDQQTRWCTLPSVLPSVVQKAPTAPNSGDIHDYYSLSSYYWPNMTLPYPYEPYIFRDGYRNPNNTMIPDYTNYRSMIDRFKPAVMPTFLPAMKITQKALPV